MYHQVKIKKYSTFYPHNVFLSFVRALEQIASISV